MDARKVAALVVLGGALALVVAALPAILPRPGDAEADAGPPARGPVRFDFGDCDYVETTHRVAPDRVRPLLPPAFVARVGPEGFATVLFGGARCANASAGGEAGAASFGWVSIRVEEPASEALRGSGVSVYLYRIEHHVLDDLYARAAAAVGAERVRVAALDPSLDSTGASLSIRWDEGEHLIDVPLGVPFPGGGAANPPVRWKEFGAALGGFATLEATLTPGPESSTAPGIAAFADRTPAARVLGASAAGLGSVGGDYSVVEGAMRFEPWS